MKLDEKYMRRALSLATRGIVHASPNPMVGAVIVDPCGRIIGEGYHRRCGEGHAEVNAVASVCDKAALKDSTMYVTLEPCSHYGKTPPCAQLIIDCGIPRVAVATPDPFEKVSGRGVTMLREAGVEVEVGLLGDEARALNRRFFTAHTLRRPYITLKWARSSDGFMDHRRENGGTPYRFSTPLTSILTARLRSLHDAIITTAATVKADNPRLTVRGWHGNQPRSIVVDRHHELASGAYNILANPSLIRYQGDIPLSEILADLYERGLTSVLVEAGPRFLQALIDADLWDSVRVETAPIALGADGTHPAPTLPACATLASQLDAGPNRIETWRHG